MIGYRGLFLLMGIIIKKLSQFNVRILSCEKMIGLGIDFYDCDDFKNVWYNISVFDVDCINVVLD